MDKKILQPQQQKPVIRSAIAKLTVEGLSRSSISGAIAPSTYCDIETRVCYPFAGDDAE